MISALLAKAHREKHRNCVKLRAIYRAMLFLIFLIAALLTFQGLRWPRLQKYFTRGPQRDGVVVVGAVLLAAVLGWLGFHFLEKRNLSEYSAAELTNLYLLVAVGALYFLAALRRRADVPIWISDVFVIVAACISLWLSGAMTSGGLTDADMIQQPSLQQWSVPLTILWMWLIARMTAAINRAPQVTGGHLGIVAIALLLLMRSEWRSAPPAFSLSAAAALAGAGLATVPIALKRGNFNIGWSASLALGFLLAQIATLGLVKNAAFFMLLLSLIAFGLPLLDVSFFRVRAALRGDDIKVQEQRLRLHEALLRRGIAPGKISMLYLAGGAWLCFLGVLTARYIFVSGVPLWMLGIRVIGVLLLLFLGFILFFSLARVWMRRGENEAVPEEVDAFGVRISAVSMQEALDKIEDFVRTGTPHHVVTSDANAILRAREDEEYAAIVRRAALITPDGFGVVWGARLMNLPIYERVTGVDMVTGICERAAQNNWSIYILGSEPGVAATAAEKLAQRYPGLRIAGTQHGFWKRDHIPDEEIVGRISAAKPEVLFVAFGIPAQEKFIARHFEQLNVPVCLGVGGSFDVYSEKLRRAPEYIQRSGLEWLYRVWQEPWRWKRMSYVPRFMAFALRTWMFGKRAATPKH